MAVARGFGRVVTFILGAFIAIFQQDLKGLLAYSTISHLGLITLLIGLDTPLGQVAAIFHIMNHATFKASLFMAVGIIDHETGTRDIRRLSGLWRFMPITATLAMVAAAAMAGVPLLNGFLSKEMFFAETIEIHDNSLVDQALPYLVTVASMFTVAYSLRFIRDVFFGPPPQGLLRTPREPPFLMRLPAELLVLACVVVGIVPALTIGPLLKTALHAVLGPAIPEYSLAVWHGFTRTPDERGRDCRRRRVFCCVHICSSTRSAVAAQHQGSAHFRQRAGHPLMAPCKMVGERPGHAALAAAIAAAPLAPRCLSGLRRSSRAELSRRLGASRTRFRVRNGMGCRNRLRLAAAYQAKFHRLAALILLGGAGLISCVSFVRLSAPDLALTQLLVETVTTVLLLLGLRWLPKRIQDVAPSGTMASIIRWYRVRDLVIAVGAGSGLAALAYVVMTGPQPENIAGFFVEKAYLQGGGTNIVNVILVDFRAFDTSARSRCSASSPSLSMRCCGGSGRLPKAFRSGTTAGAR